MRAATSVSGETAKIKAYRRMLAGCPDGATKLTLFTHAFEKRCIPKLLACGYCDRETRTGLHVDRYRITRAGQKAARAGQEAAAA